MRGPRLAQHKMDSILKCYRQRHHKVIDFGGGGGGGGEVSLGFHQILVIILTKF